MQRNVLVVVPSDQNDDCSLLFVAPEGMTAEQANLLASAAIDNANDDEGDRSGEVITFLKPLGFECLGNPSIATMPAGIMLVTVTAPMYPAQN